MLHRKIGSRSFAPRRQTKDGSTGSESSKTTSGDDPGRRQEANDAIKNL
jgi:hypothetical protein